MKQFFRAAIALFALSPSLHAQVRASEIGTMSQIIDGTKISMQYSRPRARGRTELFGNTKGVRWDEVWTPGANWATTLETSKAITLDGHTIPTGTYSVWMVVRKSGDWTLVLDPHVRIFHMDPPDSAARQIRFAVRPTSAPFAEVLTWSMPEMQIDGGRLAMNWGTTQVALNVRVTPSLAYTFPAAEATDYAGTWEYQMRDSTGKAAGPVQRLVIDHENNTLKGRWEMDPTYFQHFALIRVAKDAFTIGVYDETGHIYEVMRPDMQLDFTRVNGRPQTFEARDDQDKVFMAGHRKP